MKKPEKSKTKSGGVHHADNTISRRKFIKKAGMGILVTSSYSLLSMVEFNCTSKSVDNDDNGGYGYHIYEWD